jgi:hypothetical protein
MLGEGTPVLFVTFLLAMLGYAGLTAVTLATLRGRLPFGLWRAVAGVILLHVILVWTYRYGWRFELAVRNGYAGFLLFHSALGLILASTAARERTARRLVHVSFLIVSLGATGASFRYEAVAMYRIPVILCALAGSAGLIRSWLHTRRSAGIPQA